MNPTDPHGLQAVLNRLAKWRSLLAGWQLGTRPANDPEAQAVRDHREATLIMRAELSAIQGLLLAKGVFTQDEYQRQLVEEAEHLNAAFEKQFPGFKATDGGLNVDAELAAKTTKGWRP